MPRPHPRPYGPVQVRTNGQIVPPIQLRDDAGLQEDVRVTFFWWPGENRVLLVIGNDPDWEGFEPLKPLRRS
jgi:hypothetical protein